MIIAETRHFQRVGHTAAGFFGERLNHRVAIVMSDHDRVLLLELGSNLGTVVRLLFGAQRLGLLGIKVRLHQKAFGNLCHVRDT